MFERGVLFYVGFIVVPLPQDKTQNNNYIDFNLTVHSIS
jgi:hypothetical protein